MKVYWIRIEIFRNFALWQVTYGLRKELLEGLLTCKERGTLFKRDIGFNVHNLTGRDCFVHLVQPNRIPTLGRVLLPVGGKPMVTILLFPRVWIISKFLNSYVKGNFTKLKIWITRSQFSLTSVQNDLDEILEESLYQTY